MLEEENVVVPPVILTAIMFVPVPAIAVPLTLIAPGPAKVIVRVPAAEAVMPPVMLSVPPAACETVIPVRLLATIEPENVDVLAVLPPMVCVPVVIAEEPVPTPRAMVKAPLVSRATLALVPEVPSPRMILLALFPRAPSVETAALPPTRRVPVRIVVLPV